MNERHQPLPMPFGEFVALMAVMVSLAALSIDTILPAIPLIRQDLLVIDPNHGQLVISSLFIGFSLGLLVYGPLSDSFGRKRMVYFGVGVTIYWQFA